MLQRVVDLRIKSLLFLFYRRGAESLWSVLIWRGMDASTEGRKPLESLLHLKRLILETAAQSKEGHIGSAFSILDILWVLYSQVLRVDPKKPCGDRDIFILSKGHGSLALYAVLAAHGFFGLEELRTFCSKESRLGGHPDARKVPGVEASTGSLGHGFPMAVGCAWAQQIKQSPFTTYCLIGDGETNEGTVWESALMASHRKLGNLTLVVDHNHSGDRALNVGSLVEKFKAFGWQASDCSGHDAKALAAALARPSSSHLPRVIVAETIKGRGCASLENNPEWHHKSPSSTELQHLLEELSHA